MTSSAEKHSTGNLTVGDLVKARGDLAGSAVSWSEIEREDE